MVQLTDELVAALDTEAARRGQSRSAVIRAAVEEYLAGRQEAELVRQLVEGYRRVPPETPDAWGSLEEFTDQAAGEVFQRLDAEEAAAGQEPW
jgi:Arc/MetJ-type ribon-helix-helix transcriptional regulator